LRGKIHEVYVKTANLIAFDQIYSSQRYTYLGSYAGGVIFNQLMCVSGHAQRYIITVYNYQV